MGRTLLSAPPTSRIGRYPKHPFRVDEYPFAMQPIMISPVKPMETLNNLYLECRAVTKPIKNSIIGWKKEYFFFYVKISDLMVDAMRDMFVDPLNTDLSATYGEASTVVSWYTAKGGVNWLQRCTERVWTHYFADEGDVYADALVAGVDPGVNGYPLTQIRDRFWMDSLTDADDMPVGGDPSMETTAEGLQELMNAFEQLRAMNIANMTFEDFLRGYGIAVPDKDEDKPELLAHFSDFQYPSNTIDPTDGSPSAAVSWVFKNGNRDPKLFKEPGFVVGYSVTRPKTYWAGLFGSLVSHMTRAWDWSPNYLMEAASDPMPEISLKHFASDAGPLGDRLTATEDYYVDMRDLFLYGDQFQNVVDHVDGADPTNVGLDHFFVRPSGTNPPGAKYPNVAFINALFVGGLPFIMNDGFVSLAVKGREVDYTVGNLAER